MKCTSGWEVAVMNNINTQYNNTGRLLDFFYVFTQTVEITVQPMMDENKSLRVPKYGKLILARAAVVLFFHHIFHNAASSIFLDQFYPHDSDISYY